VSASPAIPQLPVWEQQAARSPWFGSHFNHAARRVTDWLLAEAAPPPAVLDFGCGGAITTLSLALRFPAVQWYGVDIGTRFHQLAALAAEQLGLERLPDNLHLRQIAPGTPLAGQLPVTAIYSWSVFEHIPRQQIPGILADLYALLPTGGRFFLQIEPLYHSPFGSHLGRFIREPWAHLETSAEALEARVLGFAGEIPAEHQGHNFRAMTPEAYQRFHLEEFRSLNRCTADDLVALLRGAGFHIEREQRNQMALEPPPALLERYRAEDLRTNGLLVLARKA
jgi:SAM-dependent methyltransferase